MSSPSWELDEGPRLLSNIVGTPWEDIRCDMPVHVVFDDAGPGITIPKFALSDRDDRERQTTGQDFRRWSSA